MKKTENGSALTGDWGDQGNISWKTTAYHTHNAVTEASAKNKPFIESYLSKAKAKIDVLWPEIVSDMHQVRESIQGR